MHKTPVSLLERLRLPDQKASWERFVNLYTPLLLHWMRRLGLQDCDARDLVQEVLTILLQKLPDFHYEGGKRFRGWLWTITLNAVRMWARKKGVQIQAGADLDDCATIDSTEEVEDDEYSRYLVGQALKVMQAEFQPTTWKACWELMISGRPAAEVANELGLSVGAVYVAKSRVLRKLREELKGLLE